MIINLSELDPDIYRQIPLSIRLNTPIIELSKLPIEIQYLIDKSLIEAEKSTYKPNKIYDAQFEISVYNDFKLLETKRAAIIEYLKNYLLVSKGSYPFDPEFGNTLKQHLQTKDTVLRRKLLGSELQGLVRIINDSFSTVIVMSSMSIVPYSTGVDVSYQLKLVVTIENEDTIFTLA
jgi:hypothetical protein